MTTIQVLARLCNARLIATSEEQFALPTALSDRLGPQVGLHVRRDVLRSLGDLWVALLRSGNRQDYT